MAQVSERDPQFTAFLRSEAGRLGRAAWLAAGEQEAAAELLHRALVRTYVAWPRIGAASAPAYAEAVISGHTGRNHATGAQTAEVPVDEDAVLEDGQEAVRGRRMGWALALITIGTVLVAFGVPPLIAAFVP
jgi:hypothetical protein